MTPAAGIQELCARIGIAQRVVSAETHRVSPRDGGGMEDTDSKGGNWWLVALAVVFHATPERTKSATR
jgi:hypothetical protein